MRTVITGHKNRQEAAHGKHQDDTLDKQHPHHPETGHATGAFANWPGDGQAIQPAEEDMYDPDLAVNFTSARGYMLQPG